jgi:hypothetical protein
MAFETDSPEASDLYLRRVIRTDFFFDTEQVEPLFQTGEPSTLGAAWLTSPNFPGGDIFFGVQPFFFSGNAPSVRMVATAAICIEAILRMQGASQPEVDEFILRRLEAAYLATDKYREPFRPSPFLQAIFEQNIVLERSPPVTEMLSTLIHGATSTSLGILIGSAFSTDPYILALTIPGGVLLMSTVMGVSTGLQRGLAKRVENYVNPPPPTRPRAQPRLRKKAS